MLLDTALHYIQPCRDCVEPVELDLDAYAAAVLRPICAQCLAVRIDTGRYIERTRIRRYQLLDYSRRWRGAPEDVWPWPRT